MSHHQSSRGQQPQQQQPQPQLQSEATLTIDQILQYLAQHTMAIEQLLSRGQTQGEAAKPPLFDGEREKVVGFINDCRLYISMRMKGVGEEEKILWVLTYVQGGVAEVWKENVLEERRQGMSAVEIVEELFTKIQEEFREFDEESRKVDELRMLEQGGRTCDEYVQIFKKISRGSGYEERPLIEEFKRGLSGNIRRRLVEAEAPPATIEEWWERSVRLDRNLRQSRAEEKVLGNCHKLHSAITPRILARFPRSKMRRKALKKTFRTMPKTCQSDRYSSRYQLISAGH